MKSQPVKVAGRVVGRVERKEVGPDEARRPAWVAYLTAPDGAEEHVGTFYDRSERARLLAIAAVKRAAADWEGTP